MLSKEAILDFQNDCTKEEIQKISNSIGKVKLGKTYSKLEIRRIIDTEIFSKYRINV